MRYALCNLREAQLVRGSRVFDVELFHDIILREALGLLEFVRYRIILRAKVFGFLIKFSKIEVLRMWYCTINDNNETLM